jgi:predicted dehydrogenase
LETNDVEPLRAEIEAFLHSIANDITPPITAEDGRRALNLALGVLDKIDFHAKKVFSV